MLNIRCCDSCGVGCSDVTKEEIATQSAKYNGTYICKNCEEMIEQIANGSFGEFETESNERCLITKDGVYVDKGMRPRGERFLGFGGSLFLISETVKGGYLNSKKIYLTNNLFLIRGINSCMLDKYKHNINAEILSVTWDGIDVLKEQLSNLK